MQNEHEHYIKQCYNLARDAGKKGFDTFGAVLVHKNTILAMAENTSDYEQGIFGHAEFNLVHKLANKYPDQVFRESIFYSSCAPCPRCLMAIGSLGIEKVVYGVSYKTFEKLLPFSQEEIDYQDIFMSMGINLEMIGPIKEEEGMRVFEYWGGEYRPLEELIKEMDERKQKNK